MKRIAITAGIILTVIIVGMIFIQSKEQDTNVTKAETMVGMLLNGEKNDESWGQSHVEGLENVSKKLNLRVEYKECIAEDETCILVMEELIEDGCKIIICNSFGYGEYIQKVAKEHPEIYFFHATGTGSDVNLCTYFGRIYQARYLSGVVAGLQTETNQIGYVAAFPIDEVNRGINAFALGVRSVNPKAKIYVEWCESWNDEESAAQASEKLLEEHEIDILTLHTDASSPLQIAEERGIWSIGYNMDNSEKYPNSFLTASVWHWEKFYEPRILDCLQGKFRGQHYWVDTDTGIIALAPLTENVKEGISEVVEQKRKQIKSAAWDVFFGPIKDQDGKLRIAEGESMTDYSMLNEFDWYVEGVVIHENE